LSKLIFSAVAAVIESMEKRTLVTYIPQSVLVSCESVNGNMREGIDAVGLQSLGEQVDMLVDFDLFSIRGNTVGLLRRHKDLRQKLDPFFYMEPRRRRSPGGEEMKVTTLTVTVSCKYF
jgi:hypothetical protein